VGKTNVNYSQSKFIIKENKMALINCPECGKEISDKVKACPHCGYPLVEEQPGEATTAPQQVEVTGLKLPTKNYKKIITIGLVSLAVIIAAVFGFKYIMEQRAQKSYEESFNSYIDKLSLLQVAMITGGSSAEELSGLVASVWSNAIYEEYDDTTDKFTRPNGYFVDDFNEALSNLFNDSSTKSTISDLEKNQEVVGSLMKELQNPPSGLEKCYDTVTELYTAYKGLTDLAINPSGNYNSFTETRREKINDFMDGWDRLDAQIPEKFGTTTPGK